MRAIRPTVLVAEDDPVVREMVIELLRDDGYSVLEAYDGLEVIRAVDHSLRKSQEPRVILLDLRLPTVDGIGVLHHLAAHGDDVPVIAISASVEYLDAALQAGATATLAKPFDLGDLLAAVADACGRRGVSAVRPSFPRQAPWGNAGPGNCSPVPVGSGCSGGAPGLPRSSAAST
jgi:CheY-like chemotaxis protein